MKTLLLISILFSESIAMAQLSGTIKPPIRGRSIGITNVVFTPAFKDINYAVTLKCNGNSSTKLKIGRQTTNSFSILVPVTVTNVQWSVKHK
jgi:hypothetical protein